MYMYSITCTCIEKKGADQLQAGHKVICAFVSHTQNADLLMMWLIHVQISHQIGDNRERRVVNNFSFSIAKINVFDCQNRYNGNRKRLFEFVDCRFGNRKRFIWLSLTIFLKMRDRS